MKTCSGRRLADARSDGSRRHLAALKNLTSDLIGRFCGAVQDATFALSEGPLVRYRADLVVPPETELVRSRCSRASRPTT